MVENLGKTRQQRNRRSQTEEGGAKSPEATLARAWGGGERIAGAVHLLAKVATTFRHPQERLGNVAKEGEAPAELRPSDREGEAPAELRTAPQERRPPAEIVPRD